MTIIWFITIFPRNLDLLIIYNNFLFTKKPIDYLPDREVMDNYFVELFYIQMKQVL
jgi:hypothetical protein